MKIRSKRDESQSKFHRGEKIPGTGQNRMWWLENQLQNDFHESSGVVSSVPGLWTMISLSEAACRGT